jgi:hypothetical protein
MVFVDELKCQEVGALLANYKVKDTFYNREFLRFDASRETKLRVYLMSAAICHQTHHLFHEKLNLWGWDFMEYGFLKMVKEKNPLLNPGYLGICKNTEVSEGLRRVFSYDGNSENSTLDRIEERTSMLMEICAVIKMNFNGSVSGMLDQAKGKLINGVNGYYEVLENFTAFSDPQKKKITFFLKLATDAGVLYIKDPDNVIPIMDYHMQRVLLRLGCVKIEDEDLKQSLINRKPLTTDEPIRGACIDAVKMIASCAKKNIMVMNDVFWPLGRSCCNETTLCTIKTCMKNPCTFKEIIDLDSHDTCLFEEVCLGRQDKDYRELWEPILETHFY